MGADSLWTNIPSEILVQILTYFNFSERLKVTSVCKRWRECLYYPLEWPKITINFTTYQKRKRANFLSDNFGHIFRDVVISFESTDTLSVYDTIKLLNSLSRNRRLKRLVIRPTSGHVEWSSTEDCTKFLSLLEDICNKPRRLEQLALGLSEDITDHANRFLHVLKARQSKHLQHLHLASIKGDPDSYKLSEINASDFETFSNLRRLSIDYDMLSTELLRGFIDNRKVPLENLAINVHGIPEGQEVVADQTWKDLTAHCPDLKVTLNLVHSSDGVNNLIDILKPSLPLTHFRMLFCAAGINVPSVRLLGEYYRNTLQYVYIIDGLIDNQPSHYHSPEEDCFVMLAWRCTKLKHFTLIGYDILDYDVLAIPHLRSGLETYNIPFCCIYSELADGDEAFLTTTSLQTDISNILNTEWRPIPDANLHPAVLDEFHEAESAYLEMLLDDQVV